MKQHFSEKQWISFTVGTEVYALPVMLIREVVDYREPVPVPGSPEQVAGVLNHRGEVISVLSGPKVLDEKVLDERVSSEAENPPNRHWRIVVLETAQGLLGMTVDVVRDIVVIDPEDIYHENRSDCAECVLGTVRSGDKLLILIDLSQVVNGLAQGDN